MFRGNKVLIWDNIAGVRLFLLMFPNKGQGGNNM